MISSFRHILALGMALAALCISSPGIAHDGWTDEELAVLASLRLSELPAVPNDPSNAWQASPAAAELGRQLFFDKRFSRNQAVACASCHDPARQFQDDKPVGEGLGTGSRRSMSVVAAGYSPWLFWDGRKDSLWSQALGPLLRRILEEGLAAVPQHAEALKKNGSRLTLPNVGSVQSISYLGQETKWDWPPPPGTKVDIMNLPNRPDFFSVYLVRFTDGEQLCGLHQRDDGVLDAFGCI